jgi:hypothetical protein
VPRASQVGLRPQEIIEVPISLRGQHAMTLQVDKSKVSRRWANSADDDFYKALIEVVTSWDLTNDDDMPYELSSENWLALGFALDDELALIEQIVSSSVPSRAEGNDSSGPSFTPPTGSTPQEQTHLNGQGTSQSETVSTSPSPT